MEYIIRVNDNDMVDSNGIKRIEEMHELIRCKDCKNYNPMNYECNARMGWFYAKPDWFCADGERR